MRILVTGREGQIATALREAEPVAGFEVICLSRPTLDLENPATIAPAIRTSGADLVVNAAAYTAVDEAESEPEKAFAINADAAGRIAAAARGLGIPVIQLSTDYVFDGAKLEPYLETDPVAPQGIYGASKLAGEKAVAGANPDHVILRTAWVYAPYGRNFVRTMLRLAGERDEIGVVADQWGSPTYAPDIADAILKIAANITANRADPALYGLFHLTGGGETSWAGFAETIFSLSRERGGPFARVKPIATADYPTPARRPANSRLDCGRLARQHGIALPPWRQSLARALDRLIRPADQEPRP